MLLCASRIKRKGSNCLFMTYRFLPVHWDQTMIIVCQSLGSRPILVLELFALVPRLFGTTSRCLSVQPVQLLPSRNIWRHISLMWPFPIDIVTPHGLLMLRNCFLDCAVEHWFGCRTTEPGSTGDIGDIEVWLIDWLNWTSTQRWFAWSKLFMKVSNQLYS